MIIFLINFLKVFRTKLNTIFNSRSFFYWGPKSSLGLNSIVIGHKNIYVGSRVTLSEGAWLNANTKQLSMPSLTIGDDTYIGRMVQINAWREVYIARKVLIADRVFISDADHNYSDKNYPIIDQNDSFKGKVYIEEGAWLGIGSVIMPGVKVGKNSIITANSVVTKDVPDYSIVSGNPAKLIKNY